MVHTIISLLYWYLYVYAWYLYMYMYIVVTIIPACIYSIAMYNAWKKYSKPTRRWAVHYTFGTVTKRCKPSLEDTQIGRSAARCVRNRMLEYNPWARRLLVTFVSLLQILWHPNIGLLTVVYQQLWNVIKISFRLFLITTHNQPTEESLLWCGATGYH